MLKTILSISGKPGLFKLVSHRKNMLIVESLADRKRVPAYAKDKVISLGDIAIYTNEAEVPLHEVRPTSKIKKTDNKHLFPHPPNQTNYVLISPRFFPISTVNVYIRVISRN